MIYLSSCSVLAVCVLILPQAEVYLHLWYRGGCNWYGYGLTREVCTWLISTEISMKSFKLYGVTA